MSFVPAKEDIKTRKTHYAPKGDADWEDIREEMAKRIAHHMEFLENNYGPLRVHEIRVHNPGDEDARPFVTMGWSPKRSD